MSNCIVNHKVCVSVYASLAILHCISWAKSAVGFVSLLRCKILSW